MSANIETLFATPRGPRDNQAVRDGENSYGDETQALVILVEAIIASRRSKVLGNLDTVTRLRHVCQTYINATDGNEYAVHGGWPHKPAFRTVDHAACTLGKPVPCPNPGEFEPEEWCSNCGGQWPNGGCICPSTNPGQTP